MKTQAELWDEYSNAFTLYQDKLTRFQDAKGIEKLVMRRRLRQATRKMFVVQGRWEKYEDS